eukprot:snap_masked-scaffold_21-processed-gene-4.4-mRNA-1 protein AED:1.00 eAED:1.00 QI:0/-1/0/0/-1/1/1/0/276
MDETHLRQAEENYKLQNKLETIEERLKEFEEKENKLKELFLREILDETFSKYDKSKFENVQITEFLRILKEKWKTESRIGSGKILKENLPSKSNDSLGLLNPDANRIHKLIEQNKVKTRDLQEMGVKLTRQRKLNASLTAKLDGSRNRVANLEKRVKEETGVNSKLSKQIEKLMTRLKHELSLKLNSLSDSKKIEKEKEDEMKKNEKLKNKIKSLEKKLKQRQSANEVLEGQLGLMDRKFIEMRTSLDFNRSNSNREIKKLNMVITQLRMQLAGCS